MPLVKANRFWNYKTFDLREMQGPDFIEKLGALLDEAGKNGWELAYMCSDFMILKQLFEQHP
ncbi:MAG TPA: hypothetical protein PKM25_14645 [Candidatus Ozemobacteraceae bacterium]|nr:hypothetical protein [Candidatus Ozemobacteraceae bacterium]